jgi:hypothetical protein
MVVVVAAESMEVTTTVYSYEPSPRLKQPRICLEGTTTTTTMTTTATTTWTTTTCSCAWTKTDLVANTSSVGCGQQT